MKTTSKPLNDRQRAFCQAVATGMSLADAYLSAYGRRDRAQSSKLYNTPAAQAYLEELRKPIHNAAVFTRQRKREELFKIGTGIIKGTTADRIRAIQADSAMTGDNKPIKVEGEVTIRRILDEITSAGLPSMDEPD